MASDGDVLISKSLELMCIPEHWHCSTGRFDKANEGSKLRMTIVKVLNESVEAL